jgi:hypothetical protein
MIHIRNVHPSRPAYVPVARGWSRLLMPSVTTSVPASVLGLPGVQRALRAQRLAVVTECNGAGGTQERLRRDMQAAIAAAERRELAAFVAAQGDLPGRRDGPSRRPSRRKRRADDWPEAWSDHLRTRWAEGASTQTIAAELGVKPRGVGNKAAALGLPRRECRPTVHPEALQATLTVLVSGRQGG